MLTTLLKCELTIQILCHEHGDLSYVNSFLNINTM